MYMGVEPCTNIQLYILLTTFQYDMHATLEDTNYSPQLPAVQLSRMREDGFEGSINEANLKQVLAAKHSKCKGNGLNTVEGEEERKTL